MAVCFRYGQTPLISATVLPVSFNQALVARKVQALPRRLWFWWHTPYFISYFTFVNFTCHPFAFILLKKDVASFLLANFRSHISSFAEQDKEHPVHILEPSPQNSQSDNNVILYCAMVFPPYFISKHSSKAPDALGTLVKAKNYFWK